VDVGSSAPWPAATGPGCVPGGAWRCAGVRRRVRGARRSCARPPVPAVSYQMPVAAAVFGDDLISEATLEGLVAARARGRVGGRRTVMTPAKLRIDHRPTEPLFRSELGGEAPTRLVPGVVSAPVGPPTPQSDNEPLLGGDHGVLSCLDGPRWSWVTRAVGRFCRRQAGGVSEDQAVLGGESSLRGRTCRRRGRPSADHEACGEVRPRRLSTTPLGVAHSSMHSTAQRPAPHEVWSRLASAIITTMTGMILGAGLQCRRSYCSNAYYPRVHLV
jgi:hypothetical protein